MKTISILAALTLTSSMSLVARARECSDDADCQEGTSCQVVEQSAPGCDPGADGGCDPAPEITEYRQCEPIPLTCDADADCPSGLSCVEEDAGDCTVVAGGPDSSARETTCEPTPGEKLCALRLAACADDSDCTAREQCVPDGAQTCSSAPCESGQECPDEPVCEDTSTANFCFPKQVACDADADCADGEVCYDLGALDVEQPPWWDEGLGPRSCFPEGFALVFDERVEVVWDDDSQASSAGRGSESAQGDSYTSGEAEDSSASDASASDGGCSVARVLPPSTHASLSLPFIGLVLGARRARSRVRSNPAR